MPAVEILIDGRKVWTANIELTTPSNTMSETSSEKAILTAPASTSIREKQKAITEEFIRHARPPHPSVYEKSFENSLNSIRGVIKRMEARRLALG